MKKTIIAVLSVLMLLGPVLGARMTDSCIGLDQESCEGHINCYWDEYEIEVEGETETVGECLLGEAICENYYNREDCLQTNPALIRDGIEKEPCDWAGGNCFLLCDEKYDSEDECAADARCEWNSETEVCDAKFTYAKSRTEEIAGQVLGIVEMVFGAVDRQRAAQMGLSESEIPDSSLEILLFVYILPILFLFMILSDMFYLMGMFRPVTAKALAAIIAMFAARAQVYLNIIAMVGGVFNNFFVGSLSLLFTMMIVWWLINHFLLGLGHAKEINRLGETDKSAITYLTTIGNHLEGLSKQKKGK